MSQIQINNTINSVNVESTFNTVDVNNDISNVLVIPQQVTNVIEIATPGPQGPPGPISTGSLINTGSFVTTSSFNLFTSSYTTGSFTGSFTGDGSGLINILSASYALTASYFSGSVSNAISSSYANTASFVLFDGLENYVAIFTSNSDLTSSNIYVTKSGVSVNTTSSNAALTVNSININRDALQIQITGSTYFAVNNEGVMVLSPFYNTPTAISGGFIYSASGEYFIGIP
jgi:hypothetical protein